MEWEVETTEEYDAWFLEQGEKMANTKVLKKTHPISELDAKMDPAVLAKAKKMAREESLNIRLAILREPCRNS